MLSRYLLSQRKTHLAEIASVTVALTCALHVVPGQLKQPHVLIGDWIKRATG